MSTLRNSLVSALYHSELYRMIYKRGHSLYLVKIMFPDAMVSRAEDLSGVFFNFMSIVRAKSTGAFQIHDGHALE